MRPSRRKPNGIPETVGHEWKPTIKVRGVPVEHAIKIAQVIAKKGRIVKTGDGPGQSPVFYEHEMGGVPFKMEYSGNTPDKKHYITIAGPDWSCKLDIEHSHFDYSYSFRFGIWYVWVKAYTMVNKRGWLRDMTVARMCVND